MQARILTVMAQLVLELAGLKSSKRWVAVTFRLFKYVKKRKLLKKVNMDVVT